MKLEINESIEVSIYARRMWNPTHVEISKGEEYEFFASGKWTDFIFSKNANGYTNWYMRLFDSKKRVKKNLWFALIGAFDKNENSCFHIGQSRSLFFKTNGTLYCFANDIKGFYWNNFGQITLNRVTHLSLHNFNLTKSYCFMSDRSL